MVTYLSKDSQSADGAGMRIQLVATTECPILCQRAVVEEALDWGVLKKTSILQAISGVPCPSIPNPTSF